jgi:hypothetical protein
MDASGTFVSHTRDPLDTWHACVDAYAWHAFGLRHYFRPARPDNFVWMLKQAVLKRLTIELCRDTGFSDTVSRKAIRDCLLTLHETYVNTLGVEVEPFTLGKALRSHFQGVWPQAPKPQEGLTRPSPFECLETLAYPTRTVVEGGVVVDAIL